MRVVSLIGNKRESSGQLFWLDRGARWLLAAVFLVAGIPKLSAPAAFAQTIGAYGLLPESMLLAAALVIAVGELVAAGALLLGRREGLLLTALLLGVFIGVLAYGIQLGLDIDCGCFGPDDPEHQAFAGLRFALARDILLLIQLSYSYWYSLKDKT